MNLSLPSSKLLRNPYEVFLSLVWDRLGNLDVLLSVSFSFFVVFAFQKHGTYILDGLPGCQEGFLLMQKLQYIHNPFPFK